jgi:Ca2+-binding EF-hand superfamily protein
LIYRPKEDNRQTSLERQVDYLISTNYDRIHEELIRLDNYRKGTVNNNDMRSLIEDLLQFPLRPDEYYQLLKKFPTDQNGKIKYKDYLKEVMDRTTQLQREQAKEDEEEEEEEKNPV